MRRSFSKTVVLVAVTAALMFMGIGSVAGSLGHASSSSDVNYQPRISWVQVSPDTSIPQAVPLCNTTSTSVPTHPTIYCYSPSFMQAAYNFGPAYESGYDGSGQTILIVDAYGSPTITQDLASFDTLFGIPAPPSFTVLCPAGCPKTTTAGPHGPLDWAIETSLDVEYAHAMAPGASIVLVVAPSNSGNALNTVERMVIPEYPGAIMSQSFGLPEIVVRGNNGQIAQANANYAMAASEGMTVLASAGDSGATNGYTTQNALFPASDPLVTAVGGTQGDPLGNTATYATPCSQGFKLPPCTPTGYGAEQVWNEAWLPAATGGAESLLFGVPTYQSGLGLTSRGTPDVSYNAAVDGGVLVYTSFLGGPIVFIVGGTSAGSPQWAAIFAIVNQAREDNSMGPIGFANPTLYGLTSSQKASAFHDITVGDNGLGGVLSGNTAASGWDLASGWGTPNVANLVTILS